MRHAADDGRIGAGYARFGPDLWPSLAKEAWDLSGVGDISLSGSDGWCVGY